MKKFLLGAVSACLAVITAFCFTACGQPGKVNVKYYEEIADVRGALLAGTESVGVMAEPAATMLEKSTPTETWYRLDLQELYDSETKGYPQAVLMVKSSLLKAYPNIVSQIESKIADNVAWAKTNSATAVNAIKGVFPATTLKAPMLSEKSIDNCKIYFQSATDAKNSVNKYIDEIRSIDQNGANAVTDDFFYTSQMESGTWDKDKITFYAPDGAPAISVAKFINDGETFGTGKTVDYKVVLAGTIVGQMATATADIILMPINGATKKYNAGGNANDPYKLVSVITHGNFYIMSKTQISLDDLKLDDKKDASEQLRLAVPMPNAVPDWTVKIVLSKHNLQTNVVD